MEYNMNPNLKLNEDDYMVGKKTLKEFSQKF